MSGVQSWNMESGLRVWTWEYRVPGVRFESPDSGVWTWTPDLVSRLGSLQSLDLQSGVSTWVPCLEPRVKTL